MTRNFSYRTLWNKLIELHGARCFYCDYEMATCIDHVVPYSHDQDNSFENLVPSCMLCNVLAGDKHFEYVEQKRQHILNKRKKYSLRRAICTECLVPFGYRTHSPSLFLCAECYDKEYKTHYSESNKWNEWISILSNANIFIQAHRNTRERLKNIESISYEVRRETLIDEYAPFLEKNENNAWFYQK